MTALETVAGVLTGTVRVATTRQLAEACAARPAAMARRLTDLERAGWVHSSRIAVRCPPLARPVCVWNPTDDRPNFHRLAYRLDTRWADTEPTPCRVWWASPLAVAEFGGVGGRVRQPLQVEHDLAVTAVYLRRGRGANWRLEDVFEAGEFGAKVPDAVVADEAGRTTVVEIGGQYSAARLAAFHQAMERLDLPYEFW